MYVLRNFVRVVREVFFKLQDLSISYHRRLLNKGLRSSEVDDSDGSS